MIRMIIDTLWRFLLVQGSRNARYVDGLGFHHVMTPALRRAARSGGDREARRRRYAGYFNADPLVVPAIAGALTRMELESARAATDDGERIERVRDALSSALSARGDHLTEIVMLPLSLTIGCACAMYVWYLGPVVFLAVYNFYNLTVRAGGYRAGMRLGERTGRMLDGWPFGRQRLLGALAAFAAGAFTALVLAQAWRSGGARPALSGLALIAAAVLLGARTSRLRITAALLGMAGLYLAVW